MRSLLPSRFSAGRSLLSVVLASLLIMPAGVFAQASAAGAPPPTSQSSDTPQAQPQSRLNAAVADLLREPDGEESIRYILHCQLLNYFLMSMKQQQEPTLTAS